MGGAGVDERLGDALVRIAHVRVLAHDSDRARLVRRLHAPHEFAPRAEVGIPGVESQLAHHQRIEPPVVEHQGHLIDRLDVHRGDHRFRGHVAEQRDLLTHLARQWDFAAAQQHVGLDADLEQVLHAVLGGLGLHLARGLDVRHQRHVNEQRLTPVFEAQLPHRFEERQRLDVPDRAADLDDVHVRLRGEPERLDAALDLIGDMRDHLHRAAQVVATALLRQDRVIHLPRRHIVATRHGGPGEAFVVAEIQIGLGAIVRHDESVPAR